MDASTIASSIWAMVETGLRLLRHIGHDRRSVDLRTAELIRKIWSTEQADHARDERIIRGQ